MNFLRSSIVRKRFPVLIAPSAEADIRATRDIIALDKPRAAENWLRGIRKKIASLKRTAFQHALIPEAEELQENFRQVLFAKYRIIYEVQNERVHVLRVVHGARQLQRRFFKTP